MPPGKLLRLIIFIDAMAKKKWIKDKDLRNKVIQKHDSLDAVIEDRKKNGYPIIKPDIPGSVKGGSDEKTDKEVALFQQGLNSVINGFGNVGRGYSDAIESRKEDIKDDIYPYKLMINSLATVADKMSAAHGILKGASMSGYLLNPTLKALAESSSAQRTASILGFGADLTQFVTSDNPSDRNDNAFQTAGDIMNYIGGTDILRRTNIFGRYGNQLDALMDASGAGMSVYDGVIQPAVSGINSIVDMIDAKKEGGDVSKKNNIYKPTKKDYQSIADKFSAMYQEDVERVGRGEPARFFGQLNDKPLENVNPEFDLLFSPVKGLGSAAKAGSSYGISSEAVGRAGSILKEIGTGVLRWDDILRNGTRMMVDEVGKRLSGKAKDFWDKYPGGLIKAFVGRNATNMLPGMIGLDSEDNGSVSFQEAFKEASDQGLREFEWNGKVYTTDKKKNGGVIGLKLSESDEKKFKDWYGRLSEYKGLNPDPDDANQYYDYRGFWKENPELAERMLNDDPDAHFVDTYKLPGHPTFSNESKYGGRELGGEWVVGDDGRGYYKPSLYTSSYIDRTIDYLSGTGEGILYNGEYIMPDRIPYKMEDGGLIEKQDYIYNRLTSEYDIPPMQAAAIVANLTHESGLQTGALGDSGASYGIQQWRDERRKNLYQFAKERGHVEPTMDDQVDYLMYEYNNGRAFQFSTRGQNLYQTGKSKNKTFDYYQFSKSDFDNAASLRDAVIAWNQGVGRPNKEFAMNDRRYKIAAEIAYRHGIKDGEKNYYNDMGYLPDGEMTGIHLPEVNIVANQLEQIPAEEQKKTDYYNTYGRQIVSQMMSFNPESQSTPTSQDVSKKSDKMDQDAVRISKAIAENEEAEKRKMLIEAFLPNIQLAVKGVTQVGK